VQEVGSSNLPGPTILPEESLRVLSRQVASKPDTDRRLQSR